ncbi:MAG: flagellar export chaperone FliS [Gallionella sp.]
MNASSAIRTYTKVGIESSVTSADAHKLILLLYQGAILAIASAKNYMMRKETAQKGKSISHAIAIIESGLQASLDKNVGGELAQNLSSLYDYMVKRLITANLNNDASALDEVSRLLNDLKGAWESIRQPAMPAAVHTQAATKPQLTYGKI